MFGLIGIDLEYIFYGDSQTSYVLISVLNADVILYMTLYPRMFEKLFNFNKLNLIETEFISKITNNSRYFYGTI